MTNGSKVYIVIYGCLLLCLSCQYNPYSSGKQWYDSYCASCHGVEGEGFQTLYPPINGALYSDYPLESIACYVRYGKDDGTTINGVEYDMVMPAYPEIRATDLVNLINYMNHKWGDKRTVTLDRIEEQIDTCKNEQ